MIDNETREILKKINYLSPSKFVTGRITEYDIRAANISMLKQYNKISDNEYRLLLANDKRSREIIIGKMIASDKDIYDTISKGIQAAKIQLGDSNNLQADEIIRIANDAVYVNRSYDLKYIDFDFIHFKEKGIYNSMLQLKNIVIFNWYDANGINLETKGLGENEYLHQKYMLSMIGTCIYLSQQVSIEESLKYLSEFYQQYISKSLPIGYYRELNSGSYYSIDDIGYNVVDRFKISSATIDEIDHIDISYNAAITRELYSILFGIYTRTIRVR